MRINNRNNINNNNNNNKTFRNNINSSYKTVMFVEYFKLGHSKTAT